MASTCTSAVSAVVSLVKTVSVIFLSVVIHFVVASSPGRAVEGDESPMIDVDVKHSRRG